MAAAEAQRRDAHMRDTVTAWETAALLCQALNTGKLPNLRMLLESLDQPARPTVERLRSQLEIVSAKVGIPIRPVSAAALAAFERTKES